MEKSRTVISVQRAAVRNGSWKAALTGPTVP